AGQLWCGISWRLDRKLDFGEITLRIAFENHSRALEVHFTARQLKAEPAPLGLGEELPVGAPELRIWSLMDERQATLRRQHANLDVVPRRDLPAQGNARF